MPPMSGRGSAPSNASTKFIFRLVRQQRADHLEDLRPRLPFSRPAPSASLLQTALRTGLPCSAAGE